MLKAVIPNRSLVSSKEFEITFFSLAFLTFFSTMLKKFALYCSFICNIIKILDLL